MKPIDKRKPETIIRSLRAEIKARQKATNGYLNALGFANTRVTKMDAELTDWKRRFDALLAAIPELRKVQG
jgi:hypothetical protein